MEGVVLEPPPLPRRRERWWLHVLLFVATLATTTFIGAFFAPNIDPALAKEPLSRLLGIGALNYSLPLLAILFAHEMGHYLTCLWYGVDASPPYFIPFPLPPPFLSSGTLGAFIRIREPFRDRRQLFDVGVGGPIAGFVVAIPVIVYGLVNTRSNLDPPPIGSPIFGYPLAISLLQKLFLGETFTSLTVYEHPALMAGWFGLLVTALNLLPVGQLDGGHALYAVMGRHHRKLAIPLFVALGLLGFQSPAWWVWMVIILIVVGVGHPPVREESVPLGGKRRLTALAVLAILVLCFTPNPIWIYEGESPSRRPPREGRGTVVHQLDLHRGPKDPGRDGHAVGAKRGGEPVEARLRDVGPRGTVEPGTPPTR